MRYVVTYTSVDGAGRYPNGFSTVDDAIDFADAQLDRCERRNGNPWGYAFRVLDTQTHRTAYRCHSPSKLDRSPDQVAMDLRA